MLEYKGSCPNCCYNIRSTQFPRISLYALTLRFVLIEINKVVKLFIRRGATQYFWQYSVYIYIYKKISEYNFVFFFIYKYIENHNI